MSIDTLLHTTPAELTQIKHIRNRTDENLAEDVQILKEWLRKQPHLPYEDEDLSLEHVLRSNKFSIEKSKKKLDMYYTMRGFFSEFFENRDLFSDKMQKHLTVVTLVPLPKLTEDFSRVHVFRYDKNNADDFDIIVQTNYVFASADYRFKHDQCLSDTYILDFGNSSLGHVLKHTPMIIKKGIFIIEKGYSDRIKCMHFVNTPQFAFVLINLVNSLLAEKMANRVHVHKDYESLQKYIPKSILPTDYDGLEKPLVELNAQWRKELQANNSWIKKLGSKKSNESLRQGELNDADFFGSIHGSFRQLNID